MNITPTSIRRLNRYAIGQHSLACQDLGVGVSPDDPGPTLHEAVQELKLDRERLEGSLLALSRSTDMTAAQLREAARRAFIAGYPMT